jgi:tetratricopeptide (TPR) repeat protein
MIKTRARHFNAVLMIFTLACTTMIAACSSASSDESTPTAATASNNKPNPELLQQADKSYLERADLARVREKEKAFSEGVEAGETAVKAKPDGVEGHFWLGANRGGYAQTKGPLYGLSAAEELRKEMETVLKLDEGFQGGSAFMVLGRLDLELPSMLGGDPKRAVETLERGLKYGDQNSLLRVRLAEAYLRMKRTNEAREQINFVLKMKPHPDFLPEHEESVTKARELLQKRF